MSSAGVRKQPPPGRSHVGLVDASPPSATPRFTRSRDALELHRRDQRADIDGLVERVADAERRAMRVLSLAMKRSSMDSCTSRREPAQQTWPWLNQMASTTPSTAESRSASSKTMKGDLPPSSRRQPLAGAGGGLADDLADFGRAGEGDLVDAGVVDDGGAGLAVAGDDVDHTLGQAGLPRRSRRTAAR